MSTKSHFLYEHGIECYEETSESQSIFGKFSGYNVYIIIEPEILNSFKIKGEYLYIETKDTEYLPAKFKIWGDAVLEADIDKYGLTIILKGGHHITKEIIELKFRE